MKNRWIYIIAGFILVLDQYSKWLVKTGMALHESILVWGADFFRLTYVENDGIAFGMPFGDRLFKSVLTFIAIVFLFFYIRRMKNAPVFPKIGLGLILGGACGNFIDRVLRGSVVDFFDFDFPDFIMERFAIFNIADSGISIGITILIIYLLFFEKKYNAGVITPAADTSADNNNAEPMTTAPLDN